MRPTLFEASSVEWYTPVRYIDAARSVLGAIDLDPASCLEANATVLADRIYTADDDGLSKEWHGRVWMNPPYTRKGTGDWIIKLRREYEAGRVTAAIALVNATTDRKWFLHVFSAAAVCFTNHRIRFRLPGGGEGGQPVAGSAFAYWGPRPDVFAKTFSPYGTIVRPA